MKSMNKIGILTLYKNNKNFGGLLQAYALQKVLADNGIPCEQISYTLSPTPWKQKLKNSAEQRSLAKNLKMIGQQVLGRLFGATLSRWSRNLCQERFARFAEFESEIPHSQDIYTVHSIKNCGSYDAYITGSDQVWNGGIDLEAYSLHFVNGKATCLSYAASYAGERFSTWQKGVLQESLAKYKAISVREKSLAESMQKIMRRDVSVVLDPVMLMTSNQWTQVMRSATLHEPFVFCYLLGDSHWHRKFAQKVAKDCHCQLVTIPYAVNGAFRFSDWRFGDIQDVTSGPREFLWLIRHAQCVVTDSFHATAFSILFHKSFWALPRYKAANKNRRLLDVLQEFGLQNRMVSADQWQGKSTEAIDFDGVDRMLANERRRSFDYLKNALEIQNET